MSSEVKVIVSTAEADKIDFERGELQTGKHGKHGKQITTCDFH